MVQILRLAPSVELTHRVIEAATTYTISRMTSHRNMERAGMRVLFLRAIWTPLV
jgi:hypothetical protein